jgi:type II secretory pathway pseudopilin PulG
MSLAKLRDLFLRTPRRQKKIEKIFLKALQKFSESGMSFVEVLVATSVLAIFFTSVIAFYAQQRLFSNSYVGINQCRAALTRAIARIDAGGGGYNLPALGKGVQLQNNATSSPIYLIDKIQRVSLNPNILLLPPPRTYGDRFAQFLSSTASPTARLFDTIPKADSYKREDGTFLTPDYNGILLYTPLLMQGAVADLADLYDLPSFRGNAASPLPPIFQSQQDLESKNLMIQIQRYNLNKGSSSPDEFTGSGHFWPIPRIQFGIPGDPKLVPKAARSYEIRDSSNDFLIDQGKGPAMKIAVLPHDENTLQMSWDYGFLVTLSLNNYQPSTNFSPVSCQLQKEYSLPPAYHNTLSFQSDFDILDPPAQAYTVTGQPQKQRVNPKLLSNKNDILSLLGQPGPADAISTMFSNVSVKAADGANNRPICTQDSSIDTKTLDLPLTVTLKFRNLSKEPGAIPMCLDSSGVPAGLRTLDGSDYQWCPSDINKGAEVRIVGKNNNGASPAQQGWVPCENLNLCHLKPDAVQITPSAALGLPDDTITYSYQYNFKNDSNTKGSSLWGCMMSVQTAVLDPVGNLSYVPAGGKVPNSKTGNIGSAKPAMSTVPPFIYFKPPPCYTCKCKNCKGSKSLLGLILALIILVVAISFAQPELFSVFSDAYASVMLGAADLATAATLAVGGIAIAATATCFLQAAGATNAGLCTDGSPITYTAGGYNSCRDSNNGCSCGYTCQKLVPPDPYFGQSDWSMGSKAPSQTYCVYNNGATNAPAGIVLPGTGGYAWQVKMGLRDASGSISKIAQADIGQMSSYSMMDNASGFYCASQRICTADSSSLTNASWQVYVDVDYNKGVPTPMEGCVPIKVGTQINVGGNNISKGAAKCIKPDLEFSSSEALKDFSSFNCQAFNGVGAYNISALASATSFAGYTGIAGQAGALTTTPYYSTSAIPGFFFPAVLPATGNCSGAVTCDSSSGCISLAPYPTTTIEGTFTGGPISTIVSNDCNPKPSSSAYSCSFGPHGFASTCYDFTYNSWTGWNKCVPPPNLSDYMFDAKTMMSFENWTSVPGSIKSVLPFCSSYLGGSFSSTDVTCPAGLCCGGSCP